MKIYLAARVSKRPVLQEWSRDLELMGHIITSRWSKRDSSHFPPSGLSPKAADDERRRYALEDIADILESDCVLSLCEEPRGNSRGGRLVEMGVGLGLGLECVIIGPRETIFHHLPQVLHFDSWHAALLHFARRAGR